MRNTKCLHHLSRHLSLALALSGGWVGMTLAQNGPSTRANDDVSINVGRSVVVPAPRAAKRVAVTDPKIADVQVLSPKQLLVSGKSPGTTDLIVWDADDIAAHIELNIRADRKRLNEDLSRLFPGSTLDVTDSAEGIVITGTLARAEDTEQLKRYMDFTNNKYVDMTRIAGVQQVQIKVMMAEANRVAIKALGVNIFESGSDLVGGSFIGPDSGGALNSVGVGQGGAIFPLNLSPATNLFANFPDADLLIFVQALAENQYLRVLAEPSLVALSGEEANFLAGGEFPIPIVQGAGATVNGSALSIEYKEFGVRLRFRPTVMGDGTIRLHVAPEVSELSNVGSVVLQGFSVPGILTRRAETTVELKSGQTFGMAGLISQSTQARSSRVPGLGDLPVLGALFRSVRYQQGNTELLLLVTASVVEPLSLANRPPVPGETHAVPNDWELYALGRVEGTGTVRISESDADWLQREGLYRLRGPGAWATHDVPSAVRTAEPPVVPAAPTTSTTTSP